MKRFARAAVLGAGVMGSQIAAHMINAGLEVTLLDIVPETLTEEEEKRGLELSSHQVRNRFALGAVERLKKAKPSPLFRTEWADRIVPGNFEDDLERLKDADIIIEAVVESLPIKQSLMEKIAPFVSEHAIVTTNTSGIPIHKIGEGMAEGLRKRFLGTHFFNPPRYMRLLEIIPTQWTAPEVVAAVREFGEKDLGKGVVIAKDTPNFIANRIGIFAFLLTFRLMEKWDLTVEEVDALTGKLIGHPKTATYRTADMVGLDIIAHVAKNVYEMASDDPQREIFNPPEKLQALMEKGWLGAKTGQGFYRKTKEGIEVLDLKEMTYRPKKKVSLPILDKLQPYEDPIRRLQLLLKDESQAARFVSELMLGMLNYVATQVPEISDRIEDVDNAMKWGFAWKHGPFELWDALGVNVLLEEMEKAKMAPPELAHRVQATEAGSFYVYHDNVQYVFDPVSGEHRPLERPDWWILLKEKGTSSRKIKENPGATLWDIGDDVACLEFHTKMNAIGGDIIAMIDETIGRVESEMRGLVVANHASNFSAGANLMLLLFEIEDENWEEIDFAIKQFQDAFLKLKYAQVPVVTAPAGMALGGGCEICLAADRVVAHAETYMGLVEVGVGLIPAGGGCKESLIRAFEGLPEGYEGDYFPFVRSVFETIGMARVSTSAEEARKYHYLRREDSVCMNRDALIHQAKAMVLAMDAQGYRPPRPPENLVAMGDDGRALLELGIYYMEEGKQISPYDAHIGRKLAWVLTGGDVLPGSRVTEQYILDLEREAFLSLCGEEKTQERIRYMLQKGKPLRN